MGRTSDARKRILNAAGDLLWEHSCHSVSVDEICTRAGVLKGSFYHFFKSKSALMAATLQHIWETVVEPAYEKYFSSTSPPLERITGFLQWVQRCQWEKHRAVGRVLGWPFCFLGYEPGAAEREIREKLCTVESAEIRYFETAIRDAMDESELEPGDSHATALSLRAAMEWVLARARNRNDLDELTALATLPTILSRRIPQKAVADVKEMTDARFTVSQYEITRATTATRDSASR